MDSKNPSGAKSRAEVYDWIQCIIFALVFCVLLFVFAVRMVNVVGHSMVPTLEQSDKVVISNLFYHPKQGDIVVLRKQTLMDEPIVKRIIATEGQTVDIDFDTWTVTVTDADGNAKILEESYRKLATDARVTSNLEYPVKVGEGQLFVMGDNRNHSLDSRSSLIGLVDENEVIGKVLFRFFPLNKIGTVH